MERYKLIYYRRSCHKKYIGMCIPLANTGQTPNLSLCSGVELILKQESKPPMLNNIQDKNREKK